MHNALLADSFLFLCLTIISVHLHTLSIARIATPGIYIHHALSRLILSLVYPLSFILVIYITQYAQPFLPICFSGSLGYHFVSILASLFALPFFNLVSLYSWAILILSPFFCNTLPCFFFLQTDIIFGFFGSIVVDPHRLNKDYL